MGEVIRVFIPVGLSLEKCLEPSRQHVPCRLHAAGLDLYMDKPGGQPLAADPSLSGAPPRSLAVTWLPSDPPSHRHSGSHPTQQPGNPPSGPGDCRPRPTGPTHTDTDRQPPGPDPQNAPAVTLYGIRRVCALGRDTVVPVAVRVAAGGCQPQQPTAGTHHLQVFLYDKLAWQRVAEAEADGSLDMGGWAPSRAPEPSSGPRERPGLQLDRELLPPPPLRMAMRLYGSPYPWDVSGSPEAPTQACRRTEAVQPTGSTATVPLPALPPPTSLACRVACCLAAAVAKHTATGRHLQHILSCAAALSNLYSQRRASGRWSRGGEGRPAIRAAAHHLHRHEGNEPVDDPASGLPRHKRAQYCRPDTTLRPHNAVGDRRAIQPAPPSGADDAFRAAMDSGAHESAVSARGGGVHVRSGVCSGAPAPHRLCGRAAVLAGCLLVSLALQLAAGPAAAFLAWRYRSCLIRAAETGAVRVEALLRLHYKWFMTATPAGVKLHGELCALLGLAAHALLHGAATVAQWAWPRCARGLVGLIAAASIAGGLGGGLAVMHDLLWLATVPLSLQTAGSAQLLSCHLAWLCRAWAMTRGNWRKTGPPKVPTASTPALPATGASLQAPPSPLALPAQAVQAGPSQLRQAPTARAAVDLGRLQGCQDGVALQRGGRSSLGERLSVRVPISRLESLLGLAPDPGSRNEVLVEQLIVGVLLLVVLVALLPTVVAFHSLALTAWAGAAGLRLALFVAAGLLCDNPLVVLAWRAVRPLDFPGTDVAVQVVSTALLPPLMDSSGGLGEVTQPASLRRSTCENTDVCFIVEPLGVCWVRVAKTSVVRSALAGWGAIGYSADADSTKNVTVAGIGRGLRDNLWSRPLNFVTPLCK